MSPILPLLGKTPDCDTAHRATTLKKQLKNRREGALASQTISLSFTGVKPDWWQLSWAIDMSNSIGLDKATTWHLNFEILPEFWIEFQVCERWFGMIRIRVRGCDLWPLWQMRWEKERRESARTMPYNSKTTKPLTELFWNSSRVAIPFVSIICTW